MQKKNMININNKSTIMKECEKCNVNFILDYCFIALFLNETNKFF